MVLKQHASISACAAAAVYLASGDLGAAFAFWVGGTLVDLDHLEDYWRDDGFNLDIPRFLGYFEARRPRRLLLALHGWEWPVTLAACALGAGAPPWLWAGVAGWLTHLALDQRFNQGQQPLCYWFAFRRGRRFQAAEFYAGGPE